MTKSQLDNLIDFCFNFHETMGVNLDSCSADYLLEKWHKYIGTRPYSNDSLNIDILNEEMKDVRKYRAVGTTPLGLDREDIRRIEELVNWSNKWGNYHEVKEILYFITIINSKGFTNDPDFRDVCWLPSQLVDTYREWAGDPEKINFQSYRHLHSIVKREISEWLSETNVSRDYKLSSLI